MEPPSELDAFLSRQSSDGKVAEEGCFTIAREEALRKVAQFQLPFANAWIVKLVQSAVAAGTEDPISVHLLPAELRFHCSFEGLSQSQLEQAFFDPEPSGNQSLDHLTTALRALALKEELPFQIRVAGWEKCLIWDGAALTALDTETPSRGAILTVGFSKKSGLVEWVKQASSAGRRNAELLTTLKKRCYPCPVPLTVDGRRLDTLYHCTTHGPTTRDYPIAIGFAASEKLLDLKIPQGTFEFAPDVENLQSFWTLSSSPPPDPSGLEKVWRKSFYRQNSVELCSAPFLVTVHRDYQRNKWVDREERSMLYWVKDGAVVDDDVLLGSPSKVSLAVFLNADGLKTDMTSFYLAQSEEKNRRFTAARRAVSGSLQNLASLDETLQEAIRKGQLKGKILGGSLLLLGVATVWAAPVLGVGLLGSGGVVAGVAGNSQQRFREEIRQSLLHLQDVLLI